MVALRPGPETVLVVDDNDVCRTALARLLRDAGLAVVEAADGRDALTKLAGDLSLVILDVVLPDLDGFEVCRSIRAVPRTAGVPVLMMSGIAVGCSDRVHGLEAGADAFLLKPVEPDELVAHARALLRERRRVGRQYLQSQKLEAVGRLAGGVAHDMNNLLTVINGYADLLYRAVSDPIAREMVREVQAAGERGTALVRQLLALSRHQPTAPRPIDVNAVVTDIQRLLRRLIGEDVRLDTQLDPRLRPVKVDAGQVEQVILNLAVNARDAMPHGGTLTVATRNEDRPADGTPGPAAPHAVLEVSDTGTGMTDEVKRRAFEPFFTTKAPDRGTGLGLATIHEIVRQAGGHIEVATEPGHGTTFRVYLPTTAEAVKPKSDPGPSTAPRGTETLLLVEDDDAVRSLGTIVLRGCGYTVLEARNADEALEVAARHDRPIPLLVTDVVMPGLGGRELAKQLTATQPGLRVLYLSGYPIEQTGGEPVNFLQKPFTAVDLSRKVRKALEASPRRS